MSTYSEPAERRREVTLSISWVLPDDYSEDWRDDPTVDEIIESIPEHHPLWGDVFIMGEVGWADD